MIVREATNSDIPAIAKVHVDSWRTTYRGIVSDEYLENLSYKKREKIWYQIFNDAPQNNSFIYVAEDESHHVVGFADGGLERTGNLIYRGELNAIYILKSHQKQGMGRKLVQKVAQRLGQMEIRSMLVWVLADNPAHRFYELLGGQKVLEKEIERGSNKLTEIAYGWTDISNLQSGSAIE
ncbi:Uncharacterized N-acetyltransferase YuaI [Hyella patelloides LEGE 07179]|uniref:Uncharacterized N-acetyltransferase YuaI n=1 Tax=Hyella patelloides LEGE 07179 TaxID=945734 RepID=A0A563VNH3_9CYAN|nr:GNAT family N-acetyltransferase [Hyella patelloides]VEP12978.1 Uncharacterized N-acetyltransferase YuaI [Hyella patelloides LEGE 07179]